MTPLQTTPLDPAASNEKFISCDCHSEFIRLNYDKEIECFDVSIWTLQASSKPHWRTKLRWLWRILTNDSPYGDQVIINEDKAKELADYILEKLASKSGT
jgi:hypothetical protein